jgi:hypothetical protein
MKKQIEIEIPSDWSSITLQKYLDLTKDLKSYQDNEEATLAVMFHHLCNIKLEWLKSIDIKDFLYIKDKLNQFLHNIELPLQRVIKIDGVEYGFEPNLSNMSYGAYIDICSYDVIEIGDKWADVMSILYRPIVNKIGKLYETKTYDGNVNPAPFLSLGMDIHLGALFFLRTLWVDLLNATQNYLTSLVEIPPNIKSILDENGNLTLPLSNYQEEMSSELTKLSTNH